MGVTAGKKVQPLGGSWTAFLNLCFSPRGRGLHPLDVWGRVPRRIWGSESHQGPGLSQLVTPRLALLTQISRPQLYGHAELAAVNRAALGPCRNPDLLRGLGAACGLVSARAPTVLRAALGLAALLGENRFLPVFLHSVCPPTYRFVVYKLPAHTESGDATQNGLRYKYFDEHSEDWSDGVGFINSTTGAVGRSLLPLYRNNNSQVMTPPAEPGVGL